MKVSREINGLVVAKGLRGFLINLSAGSFVSHKFYPLRAADVKLKRRVQSKISLTALIVQGPVGPDFKFLLETLKLYSRLFSDQAVLIVPVIWSDESDLLKTRIEALGIKPVIADKPKDAGLMNVNFQTIGVSEGINYAMDQNCEFIVRSRTDCRIYDPDAISKLHAMRLAFPLSNLVDKGGNKIHQGRIIASSLVTCMYRVYGLTDILLFGSSEEMLRYFNPEIHSDWIEQKGFSIESPLNNGTPIVSEIFLCARYLDNLGISLDWDLEHWHRCLVDHFIIIDAEMIDLFWKKYEWQYSDRFNRGYSNDAGRLVKFSDWLVLFTGNRAVDIGLKEEWEMINGELRQKRVQ